MAREGLLESLTKLNMAGKMAQARAATKKL